MGYVNEEGYWKFKWCEDRFVMNGIVYKGCGDSEVCEGKDEGLVLLVMVKRDRDSKMKLVEENG